MSAGQRVGYVRVSSTDQNTARQLDGIELDRTFTDLCSGKDTNRPQLVTMLAYLREGDTLFVHSLDRLGRNLSDLLALVRGLIDRGVGVVFVKNGLSFAGNASPTDRLLLAMLGAIAEFERDMIRERQAEGIALAKAKGVYKGRKPKLDAATTAQARQRIADGVPLSKVARDLKVGRTTLYTHLGMGQ